MRTLGALCKFSVLSVLAPIAIWTTKYQVFAFSWFLGPTNLEKRHSILERSRYKSPYVGK